MRTAPKGWPARDILVLFRGEAEPVRAYWCGKFYGWMDGRDPKRPPLIRHDGIGWLPLP
jgi:hypothetical protein